jgi:hypothetical protein
MFNRRRAAALCAIALLIVTRIVGSVFLASAEPVGAEASLAALPSITASSYEQPFLYDLRREGLRVGQNDRDAVNLGHAVCQKLDSATASRQTAQQLAVNAGLSAQDADKFVAISVQNYCPERQPRLTPP